MDKFSEVIDLAAKHIKGRRIDGFAYILGWFDHLIPDREVEFLKNWLTKEIEKETQND